MSILNPDTKAAYQLLHDGGLALTRCEQHGLRVDVDYIKKQQYLIDDVIENVVSASKRYRNYKSEVSA